MNYNEYYISSKDDKKLFVRTWIPADSTKAVLYIIHGFSEHSGRYTEWANKFALKNLCVYAMDYRGHGKAGGTRGHTPKYHFLLDDIEVLLNHNADDKKYPRLLYGQSLGGNMALNYALFRPHKLSGLIITSPWMRLVVKPQSITVLFSRILRILAPKLTRDSKFDMNVLSHDPQVAINYEKDPLTHSRITPQLFFGAEKAARRLMKNIEKLSVPLLLMHGTNDLVTSYLASKKFARQAENFQKDVTFIPWKGYYHELHHETGKEKVFHEITKWIDQKLSLYEI